jgi:hypothetical protein
VNEGLNTDIAQSVAVSASARPPRGRREQRAEEQSRQRTWQPEGRLKRNEKGEVTGIIPNRHDRRKAAAQARGVRVRKARAELEAATAKALASIVVPEVHVGSKEAAE